MEAVRGDEYVVEYNDVNHSVAFTGTIRLQTSEEYAPILNLLQQGLADQQAGNVLKLDFRALNFLNSSGINTVSKFVITARKEDRVLLLVQGSNDIYWQQKSLFNLQKLWPKVQIEIL